MVSGFIAGSAPVIIADAARIVRGLRNGRVSVCLSVPSIGICRVPQPGRGQQISVDAAGARAAAAGRVMLRSEVRRLDTDSFVVL